MQIQRFVPVADFAAVATRFHMGGASADRRERPVYDRMFLWIVLFFAGHALVRIFGSSNFGVDETETAVRTQVFQLQYWASNPPLFDWLFFGLSRAIGVNNVTMQLLKALLFTGAGVLLLLTARPAFRYRLALEAAIVSYGATAFFGWHMFQGFSHTIAFIFAMAFALWAVMRVAKYGRATDYLLLGAAFGVGILSKYLFALFFLALMGATLLRPAYRPAILSWRMGIAALVALVVTAPFLLAPSSDIDGALQVAASRVATSSDRNLFAALGWFVIASMEFLLPFVLILWVCLARWPATSAVDEGKAAGDPDFYPFLRDATAIMLAAALAAVVVLGTRLDAGRHFASFFFLFPLAVLARLDAAREFPALALHHFRRGVATVAVAVPLVELIGFLLVAPPFCIMRCQIFADYRPVAQRLAVGRDKQTIIVSDDVHVGSNLLRLLPDARVSINYYTGVLDLNMPAPDRRQCYFVWVSRRPDGRARDLETALRTSLQREPDESERQSIGPAEYVPAGWQTKLLHSRRPPYVLGVAPVDSASAVCRVGRRL